MQLRELAGIIIAKRIKLICTWKLIAIKTCTSRPFFSICSTYTFLESVYSLYCLENGYGVIFVMTAMMVTLDPLKTAVHFPALQRCSYMNTSNSLILLDPLVPWWQSCRLLWTIVFLVFSNLHLFHQYVVLLYQANWRRQFKDQCCDRYW